MSPTPPGARTGAQLLPANRPRSFVDLVQLREGLPPPTHWVCCTTVIIICGRVVDASWSGRSGITFCTGFWCFSQKKSTPNHLWSSQIMKNVLKINFQQSYRRISWQKWDFSGFRSFLMICCSYKSSKMTNFPIPVVIYLAKSHFGAKMGGEALGRKHKIPPTIFYGFVSDFFSDITW